jgi:hypothetical protein
VFQPTRLLSSLHEHGVECIVVGMGAAVVQGVPASTLDLDVVHHRTSDNVRRLLVCVAEWDARFRGDPRRLVPNESHLIGPGQILLTTVHGDIDLLGTVGPAEHPLDYEALLPRSRVIDFESFSARVLELSALIELKKQAGRPKDLAMLPILESTLKRSR